MGQNLSGKLKKIMWFPELSVSQGETSPVFRVNVHESCNYIFFATTVDSR